jgi:hypothetical protein
VLDGSHLHGVDAAGYDEIEVGEIRAHVEREAVECGNVTQRVTCTPIEAILRSPTQTPV